MFKRWIPTAVAMSCGVLVLLGSFLPVGALIHIRVALIRWATVIGAFAFILACLSVIRVNLVRVRQGSKNKVTSFLVIVSAVGSFGLVLWQGPYGQWPQYLLNNILIPGESALMALTAVILLLGGMCVFRTRRNFYSVVFVIVVIWTLFVTIPYANPPILQDIARFINTMATAGMRGLVIGVALGTTLTGIRILAGIDQPHSDE